MNATPGFLTNHGILQFSTDVQLLLQQQGSLLRGYCKTGRHRGTGASPVNQFGAVTADEPTVRYGKIEFTEPLAARRWVNPNISRVAIPIDNFDMLLTMEDPISQLSSNTAYAHGRRFDKFIINAADGTSVMGTIGTDTEAFDTTYQVANTIGGNGSGVGLNVEKLISTQEKLRAKDPMLFDREKKVLVITRFQHSDLLRQVEVTSNEFRANGGVYEAGIVKSFLGFDFIIVGDDATVGAGLNKVGSDRYCLAWVESGMYLGVWEDIQTKVSQRDDLESQPWQIYTKSMAGASRLEQGKVVRILCTES